MTLSDLKTVVSTWLDDTSFGYHTQAQVATYLNQAQREVQKYLIEAAQNYYFKCKKATLVVGTSEYYLPSDLLKVHRVEMVMSTVSGVDITNALNPITLNQQDFYSSGPALPQAYTLGKSTIKFFPSPSEAKVIKLTYSHRISDMVFDNETPDIPEEFHEMIALLAAKTGFIRDDKPSGELDAKLVLYKDTLKQAAASKVQQTGRRIITTQSYDDAYLF